MRYVTLVVAIVAVLAAGEAPMVATVDDETLEMRPFAMGVFA